MRLLWQLPGLAALVLVLGGMLGANTGVLTPAAGFQAFFLGTAIAALSALVIGGAAAIASALGRSWRGPAARGAILPLLVTLAVILPNFRDVGGHPIHDITTAWRDDGLQFTPDVAAVRPDGGNRAEVLATQGEVYGEINPLATDRPVAEVFERAREVAESMPRWEIADVREAEGRIEAVARSRLFRFEDDVVIRVRARDGGTRVDVRSRSRIGQSDLGANAARIRAYLAALEASL